MKQLACEMCGGTDLLKQDGVFVCQACGMKYTVEEAKKMMIEGTVEVQGVVKIQNTAQVENLWRLAKSSYESKNYAQAEEFCNQIIAIDANNYEAWKLKGEAINYQITGTNDRITEVFNCILTSFRVLDEAGKAKHREEILASIRECLEGEIDFALSLFKNNRPTDEMFAKVKKTFIDCAYNVITSYKELGYSEETADAYRTYIKIYFIRKVNEVCSKTWEDVVYYNYNRGGWTDEYHPDAEIMSTYLSEGDNLIALLRFAEEYFTNETPLKTKKLNYELQSLMQKKLSGAKAYKRMVSVTTNGYGAVTDRSEYWELDKGLAESAIAIRQKEITRTTQLSEKMDVDMAVETAMKDPATIQQTIQKWQRERAALRTDFEMPGGTIGATVIMGLIGILCCIPALVWESGFKWVLLPIGIICLIIAIGCFCGGISDGRQKQAANINKYNQLTNKINELSKSAKTVTGDVSCR